MGTDKKFPSSRSPQVTARYPGRRVCVHCWYCHDVCDACSVNKEHHYLELSSLRHSLQEEGGRDNYQLKPDFTGRSTTTIQALRDFTREPETLPAAVAASIPSFRLEKQQLAHVCVSACKCLHEPAVQTNTVKRAREKRDCCLELKEAVCKNQCASENANRGKNFFHLSGRELGGVRKLNTHTPPSKQCSGRIMPLMINALFWSCEKSDIMKVP